MAVPADAPGSLRADAPAGPLRADSSAAAGVALVAGSCRRVALALGALACAALIYSAIGGQGLLGSSAADAAAAEGAALASVRGSATAASGGAGGAAVRCPPYALQNGSRASSRASPASSATQAEFEAIYRTSEWGSDGGGSGAGSTRSATRYARQVIELVVFKYGLRSIADAPCGAMVWMPLVLERLAPRVPCFRYTGLDLVRPVVDANVRRFAGLPFMDFAVADVTEDVIAGAPDLIFCRDALQHLSPRLILRALRNFGAALGGEPGRFLLVGSYANGANARIAVGDYFHIDLRAPPFRLAPLDVFDEVVAEKGFPKLLLLYSGAQLARVDWAALERNMTAEGFLDDDGAAKRARAAARG